MRRAVTDALGRIGPGAVAAVPDLVVLLRDPDAGVRLAAFYALGQIHPWAVAAVPDLIVLLRDPDAGVRRITASALGRLGPAAKDAVPDLIKMLKDPDVNVRRAAAYALGRIGPAAKDAVPGLAELLKDPDGELRGTALRSLANIAETIEDKDELDVMSSRHLEEALRFINSREDLQADPSVKRISSAVNHLKALERASFIGRVGEWLQKVSYKDWKTWVVILLAGWLVFLFAVFLVKPLWLLRWNEALKDQLSIKAKHSDVELSLGIPLGYISLIRVIAYRRRVLDAWVKAHVGRCRETFDELATVKDRMVHVPSPVKVDGSLVSEFSAATLRAHIGKARNQCRWLIFGEGGIGKTSLACQMARWAMAPDKANRLAPHLALPVLIEDELDNPAAQAGLARFTEVIRGKLRALIGSPEPISPELLTNLLRRLRVLVIVDHFTEMSQATRDQIRFDDADFPAAALVVTTRTDAVLKNLPKHTVEPMRIDGKRLSVFIDAYLNERRKRHLFDDEEYFEACLQLSRMVGERDVTVLLAKLYADQMVAAKESPSGDNLPRTIPDLMLRYVNELNQNTGGEENRTVQRDCKAIAWECLKPTYRPGQAERTAVMAALKGDGDDEHAVEARLSFLTHRLRVILVTGAAEDRIRFVLDPLAEYLAGLQVVEENQGRGTRQKWERFLREADRMPGALEDIRGFLLAVRDCCLATDANVPDFVLDELGKRGGLDPEKVRQVQLKQRIRRNIDNLDLPEAMERQTAARFLGDIGPEAKSAIPALIRAFQDDDEEVRGSAAEALVKIGPVSVSALIEKLHDERPHVRARSAYVLGRFGDAAKASIPSLIGLLEDEHPGVRRTAANVLGGLGADAKDAVPSLCKMLQDEDGYARRFAAEALGRIGPNAKPAVPILIEAMEDEDKSVRRYAAEALGNIGPDARDAVPTLRAALRDSDIEIRRAAAESLVKLGPDATDAIPALTEMLKDGDSGVRGIATEVLERIRP